VGTQVREEDFGLLFYTVAGPRLYFLSSGQLLDSRFFQDNLTLNQWIEKYAGERSFSEAQILDLKKRLNQLKEKGVILEC
jgi:putative mycofactocin binding protein MftB